MRGPFRSGPEDRIPGNPPVHRHSICLCLVLPGSRESQVKRFWIIAGMLALAPSGAQAMAVAERLAKNATQAAAEESMTLGQFLMHWDEVQKAGVMARLSPDAGAVTRAVMRGAARYRQMVEADRAAGRSPRSCPPPPDTGKFDSTDVIPRLKALPVNDRAKPFDEALIPILHSLRPCAAS
jgi:hypothetical protein